MENKRHRFAVLVHMWTHASCDTAACGYQQSCSVDVIKLDQLNSVFCYALCLSWLSATQLEQDWSRSITICISMAAASHPGPSWGAQASPLGVAQSMVAVCSLCLAEDECIAFSVAGIPGGRMAK